MVCLAMYEPASQHRVLAGPVTTTCGGAVVVRPNNSSPARSAAGRDITLTDRLHGESAVDNQWLLLLLLLLRRRRRRLRLAVPVDAADSIQPSLPAGQASSEAAEADAIAVQCS